MRVLVLNGPNLGRLGSREPLIYGDATYDDLVALCTKVNPDADVRQTDDEATMIGWLHEAADSSTPVVLNSAAWSHYSYALRDACSQLTAPLIEVHISQTAAREDFRHTSVVSGVATGSITGLGVQGYVLGLRWLAENHSPG